MKKICFMILAAFVLFSCKSNTDPNDGNDNVNGSTGVSIAEFNRSGKLEASGYELSDLGFDVTQPASPAWVGLTDAIADTPDAGTRVMKLDFWDSGTQYSILGFSMSKKVVIPTAGNYTFRFRYKGEKFYGMIKVSFDSTEKTVPTSDWSGSANWEWNSADGSGGYDNFAANAASKVTFNLEAKTYTVKLRVDGYTAGSYGYIDNIEIVAVP